MTEPLTDQQLAEAAHEAARCSLPVVASMTVPASWIVAAKAADAVLAALMPEITRLRALVTEMTHCRDNALAALYRDDVETDPHLPSSVADAITGMNFDWDDERVVQDIADTVAAALQPAFGKLTQERDSLRAELAKARTAPIIARWRDGLTHSAEGTTVELVDADDPLRGIALELDVDEREALGLSLLDPGGEMDQADDDHDAAVAQLAEIRRVAVRMGTQYTYQGPDGDQYERGEFHSREIDSRRIEYTVPAAQPWGATSGDLYAALAAAAMRFREKHGLPRDEALSDDALRVVPSDAEVIISFTVEKPSPPELPTYKASSVSAAIAHVLGMEYNATRPMGEMADAITARLRKSMPYLNIRDDNPAPAPPPPSAHCDEMTHNSIGSETFCHLEQDHDGDHDNTNGLEWPRED